ncbi:MAG: PorV/PorQ family protein [Ignavibacteriae bacterium]|nr:PorV/PorQ family protein [Ignavibacteriota bacterium]
MTITIRRPFAHSMCVAALAGAALLQAVPATAGTGASGMAFLKLGVSSQGVAMGDAMTASASGAAATYYNPAGILTRTPAAPTFMVMHKEWIQDTRTQFIGTAFGLGESDALGVSVNTTTVSDIEIRTRPGEAQGTFTARDLAVGVSYARQLAEHIRAGVSVRYLYEQILVDNASGIAGDIGVQMDTPVEGLVAGVALANIGSMNAMRNESVTLPFLARFGVAYPLALPSIDAQATLAVDGLHLFREGRTLAALGGEIVFLNMVAVRAGYQSGSEGRGVSLGGGVRYGIVSVDYAYSKLATALGNGHTIAVGLSL